jgi:hypothetical protein
VLIVAHIQLACQRANGNIFPPNRSTVGRSELGDVFIDGIVEVKITSCVLIEQTESGESLGHTCYTVLTIAVYACDAWSLLLALLGSVVLGPKSLISRCHFDRVRRAAEKTLVNRGQDFIDAIELCLRDPWTGLLRGFFSDSQCNGTLEKAAVHTSFHCGTAKAGEGSWQLADATATQVATRKTEKIAIGGLAMEL